MKLGIFSLNAALVNSALPEIASEVAKTLAFGFAWASILHLCSTRYIAKALLRGDERSANISSSIAATSILISVACVISYEGIFTSQSWDTINSLGALFIIATLSYFDLGTSLANAAGQNRIAAKAQIAMGLVLCVSATATYLNFPTFPLFAQFLIACTALLSTFLLYLSLRNSFPKLSPAPLRTIKDIDQIKDLLRYSVPSIISAVSINPLILWAVVFICDLSGRNFVIFLVCQNLLGLAMLLPGQINTTLFSYLAKKSTSHSAVKKLAFSISILGALASVFAIHILLPYAELIYGDAFPEIAGTALWFTSAAIPFTLAQMIATFLFIDGRPWVEAKSNLLFGVFFIAGCYFLYNKEHSLESIGQILLMCYCLRLFAILFTKKN